MKIGVDFREASKQNKAGKGWFAYNLMRAILEQDKRNEYVLNSVRSDLFLALTSFIIPALAPKRLKTIVFVHDLVAFLFPKSHNKKAVLIERLTLNRALKKAAHIITISENTKKDLLAKFNPSQEKITIIYPAASDNFKPLNIPRENFILAVGTLEPRKNFIKLIDAFAALTLDFPELKLVIVGGNGWQYKKIFSHTRNLKLEGKIIFKGHVRENELIHYYNTAQVFVFPSLYEGFGIPPLEAMKCGCPVVASNTSSMPEVVGSAGLLVNPNDTSELAKAIKQVLTNQGLRNRLVEAGYKQAQKFSYKASATRLLQVINNI